MKFFTTVFLIVAISCLLVEGKTVNGRECTVRGEYCQNHWECCSNSCMSYLYKCVGEDRNEQYQPPIFLPPPVTNQKPEDSITLDELLKRLYGQ